MPQSDGLAELVHQIDEMVETVVGDSQLNDASLRRVLRFLSQVIQVVEQAFQDALTLLIEIKFLEVGELSSPRFMELHKQVELLTARSYYRDAAEICSRLKHLRENFDEQVRPVVSHLPEFSGWSGVLGLIEDREGRIIALLNQTAWQISSMLDNASGGNLSNIRATASESARNLRSLLGELHELNSQILGFSGKEGFLELTRDRHELQREVKIMVDKSITTTVGNGNVFHGNFVAGHIQDSFNQISKSNAAPDVKQKLELLCTQVSDMVKNLSEEKQKEILQDLSSFIAEASKPEPRRKWFELSAEGLLEAAKACAGMASPVISTVKEVLALVQAA